MVPHPGHTLEPPHGLLPERVGTMLEFLPTLGLDAVHGGLQLLAPRESFSPHPALHLGQPSLSGWALIITHPSEAGRQSR
jgi:hypothetical protein